MDSWAGERFEPGRRVRFGLKTPNETNYGGGEGALLAKGNPFRANASQDGRSGEAGRKGEAKTGPV